MKPLPMEPITEEDFRIWDCLSEPFGNLDFAGAVTGYAHADRRDADVMLRAQLDKTCSVTLVISWESQRLYESVDVRGIGEGWCAL